MHLRGLRGSRLLPQLSTYEPHNEKGCHMRTVKIPLSQQSHVIWEGFFVRLCVVMTAFVLRDVAIKMNLLLYRLLNEQIDI